MKIIANFFKWFLDELFNKKHYRDHVLEHLANEGNKVYTSGIDPFDQIKPSQSHGAMYFLEQDMIQFGGYCRMHYPIKVVDVFKKWMKKFRGKKIKTIRGDFIWENDEVVFKKSSNGRFTCLHQTIYFDHKSMDKNA